MMYMLVPLYVYIGTLASIYKGSNMEVQGFSVLYIYMQSLGHTDRRPLLGLKHDIFFLIGIMIK